MRAFFFWLIQEANAFTWIFTITLDLLWNLFDGVSLFSGIGVLCYPFVIGGIFSLNFLVVTISQHYFSNDEWNPAMKKGLAFGALAAMPFSVVSVIAGMIGLVVKQSMGPDYTYQFGKLGLNYRELEKIIKQQAIRASGEFGSWREMTMEKAINILEQCGKLSRSEAHELHELRRARNDAQHVETPANLHEWVSFSEQLFNKYSERFGIL